SARQEIPRRVGAKGHSEEGRGQETRDEKDPASKGAVEASNAAGFGRDVWRGQLESGRRVSGGLEAVFQEPRLRSSHSEGGRRNRAGARERKEGDRRRGRVVD